MKRLAVSILFVVIVLVIAACGGGAATQAPTATPPAPTAASVPTSVPTAASAQATVPAAPKATPIVALDDPGLKTTASGLKYADVVAGTGATPATDDWVTVEFTATLQDGTLIGASSLRGGPATLPLADLAKEVAGWAEGMRTMKVGGIRELVVPPNLAYGDQGAGNVIPPNATLIFVVEMIGTKSAPKVDFTDLVVGTGAEATVGKSVVVNYTGTLTNGIVFDSSFQRNEPFTLTLGAGQVIPGWEEGLQGMKVGGTRVLTIPSELAYGPQGAGGMIPPNATLVFQIQLVDVK
jgi:peptidylprolyl isomerase